MAKDTAQRTRQAQTPVNERQGAGDTAHTCASRAAEGGETTSHGPWVKRTGATQPPERASSRGGTPRPLVSARQGCIGDRSKRHPEPWKQPVTGRPVHNQGVACEAERPRNSSHKDEAIVP